MLTSAAVLTQSKFITYHISRISPNDQSQFLLIYHIDVEGIITRPLSQPPTTHLTYSKHRYDVTTSDGWNVYNIPDYKSPKPILQSIKSEMMSAPSGSCAVLANLLLHFTYLGIYLLTYSIYPDTTLLWDKLSHLPTKIAQIGDPPKKEY